MISRKLLRIFEKLRLIETFKVIINNLPPNSYFWGRKQLNTTWVSLSLSLHATTISFYFFRVRNYRVIMVGFNRHLISGLEFIPFYL